MSNRYERPKLEIKPTPKEVFHSLKSMPNWINLLAINGEEKKYTPFLKILNGTENLEYSDFPAIKSVASLHGFNLAQINRWIKEIYNDIFDLSCEKSELFFKEGEILIEFNFENLGNYAFLCFSLPSVPKLYEEINISFLEAKLHINFFWVADVRYQINNPANIIHISAKGGSCNKYRDFAIDKAKYEKKLHFNELWHLTDREIDDIIRNGK